MIYEQQKMTHYLEYKYGQDFVVDKPERKANGIGVEGYLEAEAYPKKDGEPKFVIYSSSSGTSDTYPYAIWERSEIIRAGEFLRTVYGALPQYDININGVLGSNLSSQIKGSSIPTFEQVLIRYPGSVSYSIRIVEDTEAVRDDALLSSRCYRVLEYVRQIPVMDGYFSCSIKQSNGGYYGVSLSREEYVNISKSSDMIERIKTWRAL